MPGHLCTAATPRHLCTAPMPGNLCTAPTPGHLCTAPMPRSCAPYPCTAGTGGAVRAATPAVHPARWLPPAQPKALPEAVTGGRPPRRRRPRHRCHFPVGVCLGGRARPHPTPCCLHRRRRHLRRLVQAMSGPPPAGPPAESRSAHRLRRRRPPRSRQRRGRVSVAAKGAARPGPCLRLRPRPHQRPHPCPHQRP
eukprot:279930-Chlamydomonas_euryale.AAC.3